MPFIDTHAHLDEQSFETDLNDVLARAAQAGLARIITIGVTASSSSQVVRLAERTPQVAAVVGIHPNYTSQAGADDFLTIEELSTHPLVVGIGETGLDRYWDYAPIDVQRDYFHRHIELSQRCGKPFVVHCREAEPETLEVLQEAAKAVTLNGVMHSFCGSGATLEACLELGLNFAVGGMITYKKNVELRETIRRIPLNRLMIETDSPYLAPVPMRGKRNEPAYVIHTARCVAELHNLTVEEVGTLTTENAQRIFGLTSG